MRLELYNRHVTKMVPWNFVRVHVACMNAELMLVFRTGTFHVNFCCSEPVLLGFYSLDLFNLCQWYKMSLPGHPKSHPSSNPVPQKNQFLPNWKTNYGKDSSKCNAQNSCCTFQMFVIAYGVHHTHPIFSQSHFCNQRLYPFSDVCRCLWSASHSYSIFPIPLL